MVTLQRQEGAFISRSVAFGLRDGTGWKSVRLRQAVGRASNTMKLISEQYDGASFQVTLGEQIAIQLPENPTTGHSWDSSDWYYPDNVDVLLNQFKSLSSAIGSGGYRRWVIKPNEVGKYHFQFGYQRNWESNPVKTFTFDLVVVKPEPKPKTEELKKSKKKNA